MSMIGTSRTIGRKSFLRVGAMALGLGALGAPGRPAAAQVPVRTAAYTAGGTNGVYPQARLGNGSVNFRHVIRLPVGTVRWRLRIANYNCLDEEPYPGAARLASVWFGEHDIDTDGSWTGRFVAGTQVRIARPVDLPVGGGQYATPWVEDPAAQFAVRQDRVLSFGVACSATQPLAGSPNKSFQNFAVDKGAAVAGVAAPGLNFLAESPLSVVVEYEFAGDNPVFLFVGNSITDGGYTSRGVASDYANRFALEHGVPSVVHAFGGGQALDFAADTDENPNTDYPTGYKWNRLPLARIAPDCAVISLGTNDLGDSKSAAQTQDYLTNIAGRVVQLGAKRVLFGRVTPRRVPGADARWDDGQERNRQALNRWMSEANGGYPGAVYFDQVLRNEVDHNLLADRYRFPEPKDPETPVDRLHPNDAGHARMAEEVARMTGSTSVLP